jgi:hypothetical protein
MDQPINQHPKKTTAPSRPVRRRTDATLCIEPNDSADIGHCDLAGREGQPLLRTLSRLVPTNRDADAKSDLPMTNRHWRQTVALA